MNGRIKWAAWLMALVSLFLLTGCTLGNSVESLFALPQLPGEYQELSLTLEQMLDAGYTYITPTQGQNIESVQMVDLNGDTVKEAVALLQHSGEKKPIKVMVFRQNEGHFDCVSTVESAAAGIDSINYHDLTNDGMAELVIGWRGENEKLTLSVYRVEDIQTPLLEQEYASYIVQPLSGNGAPGLILLRENDNQEPFAAYYTWQAGALRSDSICALSSSMEAIRRGSVVNGFLADGTPAVFVTGVHDKGLAITDVLIDGQAGLTNAIGGYIAYGYCQLPPQDIDGDGVTEVPHRVMAAAGDDTVASKDTLVDWISYDRFGESRKRMETYHCQSHGWYLAWPEDYWNRITAINGDTFSGENCVEFSVQNKKIAAIYSITCENRESRAQMGDRFIVTRLPDTIYAAEVYGKNADMNMSAIRKQFALIVHTWDAGGKE